MTKSRKFYEDRIAALESQLAELTIAAQRARVLIPLWRGVAIAMVRRASKIRCEYGGNHSMADCNCDPIQQGGVTSMTEVLNQTDKATKSL